MQLVTKRPERADEDMQNIKKAISVRWVGLALLVMGLVLTGLAGAVLANPGRVLNPSLAGLPPTKLPDTTCTLVGTERTCDLWAKTGTINLPGQATPTNVWYYAATADGAAQLPGPNLIAMQGETLKVVLHNTLVYTSSLSFPGQALVPDTTGVGTNGVVTYTLSTSQPGTTMYQAGLTTNGARQTAMGMYGGLVIRPSTYPTSTSAYGTTATNYDDEALVILSEIDPAFNANPTTFDLRTYAPKYWLINGQVYPNTQPIMVEAGKKVLLLYLNAGLVDHSISLMGLHQTVVAQDGNPLTYPYGLVAQTISAGQTFDMLSSIPVIAIPYTQFALFNGSPHVDNNGKAPGGGTIGFGGMLTFLQVAGPPGQPTDTTGPAVVNIANNSSLTDATKDITLTATLSDVTTGNSNVIDAEYFIDTTGADGSGLRFTASSGFSTTTASVTTTISASILAALTPGKHTLYVHGRDDAGYNPVTGTGGNWATVYGKAVIFIDKFGPTSSGKVVPALSNGNQVLSVQGSGDDSASGGANVTTAEYFIDAAGTTGAGTLLAITTPSSVAEITSSIPTTTLQSLSAGVHQLYVHSADQFNNWGNFVTIPFTLDKTAPTVSNLKITPNPNNGKLAIDNITPAIRIDGQATDPTASGISSTVVKLEGFLDPPLNNSGVPTIMVGTGFDFFPTDGQFNSNNESVYSLVPLTQVQALTSGPHTFYIHALDAAGNWGPLTTVILNVDKIGPTVSNLASTVPGDALLRLTGIASDTTTFNSNLVAAEWYEGNDPGVGLGSPLSATDGSFNSPTENISTTISTGGYVIGSSHTFKVRAKDVAGNWGASALLTVTIQPSIGIFANSFEAGNTAAWNGGAIGPVSVTAAARQSGNLGMQVALTGNSPGYVTDNTPNNEGVYNTRFYFNPNGAASGGNGQMIILVGRNSTNRNIFQVEYRRTGTGAGTTYQVRAGFLGLNPNNTTTLVYTPWKSISNAYHALEIGWGSSTTATLNFWVDSTLVPFQTPTTVNTNTFKVKSVILGPSGGLVPATSGTMYFDNFVSTRNGVKIGL